MDINRQDLTKCQHGGDNKPSVNNPFTLQQSESQATSITFES
jgi:hypothetical protein